MKGKAYSAEFKEQVLKEANETGNMTLVARNNNVPTTTVYSWMKKGGCVVMGQKRL